MGRPGESLIPEFLAVSCQPFAWQIDAFAVVLDDLADDLRAAPAALQDGQNNVAVFFCGEYTKPDPHIVNFEHFSAADLAVLLKQPKNRRCRGHIVDLKADVRVD